MDAPRVTDTLVTIDQTKTDLLVRMTEARFAIDSAIQDLREKQLLRLGAGGWSVKDHLSHLAVWEAPLRALLLGESLAEALGVDQETFKAGRIDQINEMIRARHHDESLSSVLTRFRESRRETVAVLDRFSDLDLQRPYAFYRPSVDPPRTEPVMRWIAGGTYEHDAQHLNWINDLLAAKK